MNLSSYRLGDLVLLSLSQADKDKLLIDNPETIGYEYIKEVNNQHGNNILSNIDNYTYNYKIYR